MCKILYILINVNNIGENCIQENFGKHFYLQQILMECLNWYINPSEDTRHYINQFNSILKNI